MDAGFDPSVHQKTLKYPLLFINIRSHNDKDPNLCGLPFVLHVEDAGQLQYQEAGAVKLVALGYLEWPHVNVRTSVQS